MKAVLVLFEKLSSRQFRGLGLASLNLANGLHADGSLDQIICLDLDPHDDAFEGRAHVLMRNRWLRLAFFVSSRLGRMFPVLKTRLFHEFLFDQYAQRHLACRPNTLLFVSRPLFNNTIKKAKAAGMQAWIQSSVAHPLFNLALVRNEELRLGLGSKGPYSDLVRAQKIARTILLADRLVTLAPEIGRFTFESYREFVAPERLLPLKEYFSIDLNEFAALAKARQPKGADDEIVFFHLSHVNLIKGVQFLLAAWQQFQASGGRKKCRLVIAGHIDQNVQQLIDQKYSSLANVEFPGFLPCLDEYLDKVDVFVSPSISDAGPATLIETMSAGMPVITSRNCGFASLVTDQKDGFTYSYNNVNKLEEILSWFGDHPEQILPMGQRARSRMEGLSAGRYAEEILGHIKQMDFDAKSNHV